MPVAGTDDPVHPEVDIVSLTALAKQQLVG